MTTARLHPGSCNIVFKQLPKSIRDAIKVTEKLGYNHLWVDSLCIIQDNDEDKWLEIAKMPQIYNNAMVTIAAAVASSCDEGFLSRRQPLIPIIEGITIEDEKDQMHSGGMVEIDGSDCETLPLDTRAWALQEALLSTRILEYRPLYVYCEQVVSSAHFPPKLAFHTSAM